MTKKQEKGYQYKQPLMFTDSHTRIKVLATQLGLSMVEFFDRVSNLSVDKLRDLIKK